MKKKIKKCNKYTREERKISWQIKDLQTKMKFCRKSYFKNEKEIENIKKRNKYYYERYQLLESEFHRLIKELNGKYEIKRWH
ncbi:MAG: hypothetical protein ACOC3Z_00545 [Nanoarchaeota archaeon]